MFNASHTILDDRIHQYSMSHHRQSISYADALQLWQHDNDFRLCFFDILADSPFSAYRWEMPPVTRDTLNRRFEFVLLNSPGLVRMADTNTYADHFASADDDGIAVFENLGKDATLVVPTPGDSNSSYEHLAAFMRSAPESKKQALWRVVGQTVQRMITDRPLWLSTAGGGVAWLHVRLDSRPKYYGYVPYTQSK